MRFNDLKEKILEFCLGICYILKNKINYSFLDEPDGIIDLANSKFNITKKLNIEHCDPAPCHLFHKNGSFACCFDTLPCHGTMSKHPVKITV